MSGLANVSAVQMREVLAKVIWTASRRDESTISALGAQVVADAVLASGLRLVLEERDTAQLVAAGLVEQLEVSRAEVERLTAEVEARRAVIAMSDHARIGTIELLLDALGITDEQSEVEVAELLDWCDCNGEQGTNHLVWHLAQKVQRAESAAAEARANRDALAERVRALTEEWEAQAPLLLHPDATRTRAADLRALLVTPADPKEKP